MKTLILEFTPRLNNGLHDLSVIKFVGKSRRTTFRASLGKFGQKSFIICFPLHLCLKCRFFISTSKCSRSDLYLVLEFGYLNMGWERMVTASVFSTTPLVIRFPYCIPVFITAFPFKAVIRH